MRWNTCSRVCSRLAFSRPSVMITKITLPGRSATGIVDLLGEEGVEAADGVGARGLQRVGDL